MPALAEGQPAHPPVVARLVAGGVLLRAPRVRSGVDEPRHVVEHLARVRVRVRGRFRVRVRVRGKG